MSDLNDQESVDTYNLGWQWCWWHRYVSDFMIITDLRCQWQNHYIGDFFGYVGDFLNVLTPQGQLFLQGTVCVWTDVKVLWTKADEGEAAM